MRRHTRSSFVAPALGAALVACCRWAAGDVSFNRDIRPILVENCFSCHGADGAARKADLRLDERDAAVEAGAIVPGDPDSSTILDRICSTDPDTVMPPPAAKKTVTPEQRDLLAAWIAAGAEYEPHWSFLPPRRPEPPPVRDESWVRNPIDRFILARLEAEGLAPAPEADRRTLARRVALDLTGLPPDPAIVEAFAGDPGPDAYEQLVDALLSTPDWGEHRGRHWLDYARYGDTHGIHIDNYREMWSFREWVIKAFNRNLPFDRFTTLQIAGDLVADHGPDASPDQVLDDRIASGFNRCNITTNEGGSIAEEYLVLYARDRTETTSAVWLGLTTGCAVCHDHKFDPLTQQEFYELAAFFNNTTQGAMDGNAHNTPPVLPVPRSEDRPRFADLERDLPGARNDVADRRQAARPDFDAWVAQATADSIAALLPHDTPLVEIGLADGENGPARVSLAGAASDLPLSEATTRLPGPAGLPAIRLAGKAAAVPGAGDFEHDQAFSVSCWLRVPATDTYNVVAARMAEADAYRGWDVGVLGRRAVMHLIHAYPHDALKIVANDEIPADTWTLVTFTYDGSGKAEGMKVFYDGQPKPTRIESNTFQKHTTRTGVPLTIGSRTPGAAAQGVGLAGFRIWGRGLSAGEVDGMFRHRALADLVKLPAGERSAAAAGFYDWWLATADEPFQRATARLAALEAERADLLRRGTVAHVMHEKGEMAKAYVLARGEYDQRGEEVRPGTPAILPAFPEALPRNRLGLAEWLLLPDHPLTARVTVNRFWQEVFGTGLVRTSGDFGTTGELPSHPELLDWLAVEFRESGWDVKRLFRLMVTSAAYRQSAATTPEKLTKDAANRLLSRGPRFRMDAEMLRDQALAASGLLVRKIGGPSVRPYQPDGVWEAIAMESCNTGSYVRDKGEGLYRRSLYWFWKRSAPPASLEIFNAPSREACCVRRERTNTPLQALVALNDPQVVEAARVLADRALERADADDETRIDFIARRVLCRPLAAEEMAAAQALLADLAGWYSGHADDARKVVTVGDSPPRSQDPVQLAALTLLASQFFNLDEVLCK